MHHNDIVDLKYEDIKSSSMMAAWFCLHQDVAKLCIRSSFLLPHISVFHMLFTALKLIALQWISTFPHKKGTLLARNPQKYTRREHIAALQTLLPISRRLILIYCLRWSHDLHSPRSLITSDSKATFSQEVTR